MTRYIDADALIGALHNHAFLEGDDRSICYNIIQKQPTVDAVPVKHGKWMSYCPETSVCSACSFILSDWIVNKFRYCPNCGARMDEE